MHPFNVQNFRGGLAVVFKDENGKKHRFKLSSKNEAHATAEAAEIVAEFFRKSPDEITTGEVLQAYVNYLGDRPTGKRLHSSKVLWNYFAPFRPHQITREVVESYIDKRVHFRTGEPASDETLWTELGHLRDAMSFAVKEKMLRAEDKPFIPRPSKPQPRDRKLSRDEVADLLAAAEQTPHLFVALLLLLGTAGRLSAVLELTWDRVDFEANTIDLRLSAKGPRKGRAKVPMNPGLRRALWEWKKIAAGAKSARNHVIVFGGKPIKSIRMSFVKAVKRAGVSNVRIHDLRHTAAVWMLQAGSSIQRISQYLGHSSLDQTFRVYARYQPDFLRAEADALDATRLMPAGAMGALKEEYSISPTSLLSVTPTEDAVSIVVDRKRCPEFAAFIEAKAHLAIEEMWRQFLGQAAL